MADEQRVSKNWKLRKEIQNSKAYLARFKEKSDGSD